MSYPRELTMTIVCGTCANQFGRWRPRCPACGEPNAAPSTYDQPPRYEPRERDAVARIADRRPPKHACIACHKGGAKKTCPHCDERVHAACLTLHAEACAEFQTTLHEAMERAGVA